MTVLSARRAERRPAARPTESQQFQDEALWRSITDRSVCIEGTDVVPPHSVNVSDLSTQCRHNKKYRMCTKREQKCSAIDMCLHEEDETHRPLARGQLPLHLQRQRRLELRPGLRACNALPQTEKSSSRQVKGVCKVGGDAHYPERKDVHG